MPENKVRVAAIRKKLGWKSHHRSGNFAVKQVIIRPMWSAGLQKWMYGIEAKLSWNIITTVDGPMHLREALQALLNLKLRSGYNTAW